MNIRRHACVLLAAVLMLACVPPLAAGAAPRARLGLSARVAQETPTPVATEEAPLAEAQGDPVKAALDQMDSQLLDLDSQVDRTQFDLNELSFALGVDPTDIIKFVRDNIAFEQYPGLLRGAQGTLMSRAGNALDEAVLLETLLTDAGYDTRIGHGALSTAEATRLVRQMSLPRKAPPPPVNDMAKFQEIIGQMLDLGALDQADKAAILKAIQEPVAVDGSVQYQQTLTETNFLLNTLQANGVTMGDPDADAKLYKEAQDYFWVEYRLGPADPWTQAQPAFKSGAAPDDLTATEYFDANLPDALNQRLQLQISIERSSGDQTETVPIMAPWVSNAADLIGAPHNFALIADGITSTVSFANLHGVFANTHYYFPLLDGKLPSGALFFDPSGATVTPAYATSPYAQLGSGISNTIASAVSAFGTETNTVESKQPSRLDAVWMDYTFLMPDGSQKTQRRVIWQREASSAQDDSYEMGRQLTAGYDFMAAGGSYPAAYRLDQTINQLLNLRPLLTIAAQDAISPTAHMTATNSLPPPTSGWNGHLSIFSIFDLLPPSQGAFSYLSEPLLVQHRQTLGDGGLIQAAIDIVNNGRRAYSSQGRDLVAGPKEALRAGVWQSLTEGIVLPGDVKAHQDTATTFAAAQAQGITMTVLTPNQAPALATMKWNEATKAAIGRDLAAGYLVIAPEQQPSGQELMAWWRVQPQTGETLGMGELPAGGGGGQSMVEYAFLLLYTGFATTFGCLMIASQDPNGITPHDLGVCVGAGIIGGGGVGIAIVTGTAYGVVLVIAVLAVLGAFQTGFWLNSSPSLDQPIR